CVVLLGATADSNSYGIVGRVHGSGRDVAFDVDGTNVVSVFGVQGAGKSYSVGNIIEAALIADPALNRLPHPLAAVVFHYSADQTYVPEYASMRRANDDEEETQLLEAEYGAHPLGLGDVRVLAPRDLVSERQQDYPELPVDSLVLAP